MLLWLLLRALLLDAEPGADPSTDEASPDDGPEGDDDSGDIRHPEKKALHDEAARWRKRFREAEARITELESDGQAKELLNASRLESAFLRAVIARPDRITDLDTAWDLAQMRGYLDAVRVSEEGEVEGMTDALHRLLGRYPWLVDEEELPPSLPTRPSGRPTGMKKKDNSAAMNRARLEERLPAIKRGGR